MNTNRYQYSLELLTLNDEPLGQLPIDPDWQPAVESARFHALKKTGEISVIASGSTIEPVWQSGTGGPYISGFQVSIDALPCEPVDFSISYWGTLAQKAVAMLMQKGCLQTGDKIKYKVVALPKTDSETSSETKIDELAPNLVLREGRLADYLAGSNPVGPIESDTFPVFVPRDVLDEASRIKESACSVETGSVMIGHLFIDRSLPEPEVFAVITAQIQAQFVVSETARLTFTPDTWADINNTIALRGENEQMLGWFHTHPTKYFTSQGTVGPSSSDFFSTDDWLLHRTVFTRSWMTALVASDYKVGPGLWTVKRSFYGWSDGMITERGFYELVENPCADTGEKEANEGGRSSDYRSEYSLLGPNTGCR